MTSSRHLPVQVLHRSAVLHVRAAGACGGFGSEGPCSAAVTLDAQPACSKVAARSAARAGFSSYNRKAVFPSSRGPSLQSEAWNAGDGLARISRGAWRRAHPRCMHCSVAHACGSACFLNAKAKEKSSNNPATQHKRSVNDLANVERAQAVLRLRAERAWSGAVSILVRTAPANLQTNQIC